MSEIGDNRLTVLAADIRATHSAARAASETAAANAIDTGNSLIEAKGLVKHGQWRTWLQTHCELSERSAQRYMQLARSGLKSATVADLGIRGAAISVSRIRPVARLYRQGPKVLLLDAPIPNLHPLSKGNFIKFVLFDLDTGEQIYTRRGVREDWLPSVLQLHGFDLSNAGIGEALGHRERNELLQALDLPPAGSPEDVAAHHVAAEATADHIMAEATERDRVLDRAIDATIALLRKEGFVPTPQKVAEFLTDPRLEVEMHRLVDLCDRRLAELQGGAA